jgi:hypothetical protein
MIITDSYGFYSRNYENGKLQSSSYTALLSTFQ